MLFCQDNRDQVRFDHPEIKPHDVARKFGEMWKAVGEDVRQVRACVCVCVWPLGLECGLPVCVRARALMWAAFLSSRHLSGFRLMLSMRWLGTPFFVFWSRARLPL